MLLFQHDRRILDENESIIYYHDYLDSLPKYNLTELFSHSGGEGGVRTRGPNRETEDQPVPGGAAVGCGEHAHGQVCNWMFTSCYQLL